MIDERIRPKGGINSSPQKCFLRLLMVACIYRVVETHDESQRWPPSGEPRGLVATRGPTWLERTAVILGPLPKRNKKIAGKEIYLGEDRRLE